MSTYWAARFLAAAELERRGYRVSIKDENAFDLLVTNDAGEQFSVIVKGLHGSGTPWIGKIILLRDNLFYILVSVGAERKDDRLFILSQSEWNILVEEYRRTHPKDHGSGFLWDAPHQHEGKWDKLPGVDRTKKRRKCRKQSTSKEPKRMINFSFVPLI